MTSEILFKFAKKGINLSPEAYNKVMSVNDPIDFSSSVIVKLKSGNYSKNDLVSIKGETIEEIMKQVGLLKEDKKDENFGSLDNFSEDQTVEISKKPVTKSEITKDPTPTKENNSPSTKTQLNKPLTVSPAIAKTKNSQKSPIANSSSTILKNKEKTENKEKIDPTGGYPTDHIIKIEEGNSENAAKFKRNLTKSNVNFDEFKIIKDTSNQSYTSGEIGNLIEYFKNRYDKLANILSKRPDLKTYQKISSIGENQTELNLIVMINEIRTTKNGHYLLECEDDTGSIPVLISKDNDTLMKAGARLAKDEVIGIIADKHGDLAICKNLIDPGVPRIPPKETDFATVFTSDVHIGSITFLEDAFVRFTKWLNGDFGNEAQMEMANDVKYMIVGGDIVDGIGVYPNQEKELAIKDITEQYNEAARLLGDVRSDIKIIITPGNHDASRVAEPQPAVPEKYAKSLYELNNVEFVSNPSVVSLDGLNVLIYHGRGIDDMVMNVKEFSHERNDLVMKEFLNKRHLAPMYGERTPLASELEDHLVIDQVPDVLHTGHVHINTYKNYKGIHCINSGTFQTQTEFQKIYNIVPTPAEVPILHKGVYKQLKFI